jgi:ATP-dependent HslUV protease ATP-binding subunit HslU
MNDTEVEIEVEDAPAMPIEIPGMGGNVGMINLSDMMGKAFGKQNLKRRKLKVPDAWDKLVDEEAEKRMDQDDVARVALPMPSTNGIVFSTRSTRSRCPTCAAVRSAAKACSAICCR